MGQYYRLMSLTQDAILDPFDDCGTGLELMEFSYIGDPFTNAIQECIHRGDYVLLYGDNIDPRDPWGEYGDDEDDEFDDSWEEREETKVTFDGPIPDKGYRYFINRTLGEYVDRFESSVDYAEYNEETGELKVRRVDPAALLIAIGNGLGGGDYSSFDDSDPLPNEDMVGDWAQSDLEATDDPHAIEGLKKIDCPFDENRVFLTASDEDLERAMKALNLNVICSDNLEQVKGYLENEKRAS